MVAVAGCFPRIEFAPTLLTYTLLWLGVWRRSPKSRLQRHTQVAWLLGHRPTRDEARRIAADLVPDLLAIYLESSLLRSTMIASGQSKTSGRSNRERLTSRSSKSCSLTRSRRSTPKTA